MQRASVVASRFGLAHRYAVPERQLSPDAEIVSFRESLTSGGGYALSGRPLALPRLEITRLAGQIAGHCIYDSQLSNARSFLALVRELASFMKSSGGAVLRPESTDESQRRFTFTVMYDLRGTTGGEPDDARGAFQEGVLSGVLSRFFGEAMNVQQVDAWGRGRVLYRYEAVPARMLKRELVGESQQDAGAAA